MEQTLIITYQNLTGPWVSFAGNRTVSGLVFKNAGSAENMIKLFAGSRMYLAFILLIVLLIILLYFNFRLRKKQKELVESNRAKDKIFSIVAHDIRGPVGTLSKMLDILVDEKHDFDCKEVLLQFKPAVTNSFEMLEDLLVWAKSNMGKLETQQVSLQLNEIVENTINQLTPITDEKNIAILFNPEHRIMVKADKVMLETVVRNLLRNAVKFSSQNDVITVNTFIKKDKAVVEVIDNGVGIPDSVQNVVLSGMYNSYGTNNEKGSGIGLIFCKELAEKNGGKLWFDSTEGKGSTFSFSVSLD